MHKVAKGDNPSVIAKKYGVKTEDFLKWNKLTSRARFQIGEEYVVYAPSKR
jgi:LysM repeat protein